MDGRTFGTRTPEGSEQWGRMEAELSLWKTMPPTPMVPTVTVDAECPACKAVLHVAAGCQLPICDHRRLAVAVEFTCEGLDANGEPINPVITGASLMPKERTA